MLLDEPRALFVDVGRTLIRPRRGVGGEYARVARQTPGAPIGDEEPSRRFPSRLCTRDAAMRDGCDAPKKKEGRSQMRTTPARPKTILRRGLRFALFAALLLLGCADGGEGAADAVSPPTDTAPSDLAVAPDVGATPDIGTAPDVPPVDLPGDDLAPDVPPPPLPPEPPRGLPATTALGTPHGLEVARAIIHIHNVFSHDACDGEPVLADGTPNEDCLRDFREALCTDRVDFAMMSEHYDLMAETLDFDLLFLQREDDEWVDEDGRHSGSALRCPDGHRAVVLPGLEGGSGEVSPIAITAHPVEAGAGGTAEEIAAAYRDDSPAGVQRLRDHGAVPVAIHIESQPLEWLRTTELDALEIGNLHVLVAPDYRSDLGLDAGLAGVMFLAYLLEPEEHPHPDLVFLEFHERLDFYMDRWDLLLGERMIAGFAGNDVHRNVGTTPMGDGERPDSYRRMMKWYGNHLLVSERTPAQAREALATGRLYMVFEVLGSPAGFEWWAEDVGDGERAISGGVLDSGGEPERVRLRTTAPDAILEEYAYAVPTLHRLVRVTAEGSSVVVESDGPLDVTAPGPGRYRVEVEITPTYLAPYLEGHEETLLHPYPWILSNPIEVR